MGGGICGAQIPTALSLALRPPGLNWAPTGGSIPGRPHLDALVDAGHQPVKEAAVDVLGQRVPPEVALGADLGVTLRAAVPGPHPDGTQPCSPSILPFQRSLAWPWGPHGRFPQQGTEAKPCSLRGPGAGRGSPGQR